MKQAKQWGYQGFTLVELAVVLVLIGMIVAVVATTGGLTDKSVTVKAISEIQAHINAVQSFYSTLSALPGDYNSGKLAFDNTNFSCTTQSNSSSQRFDTVFDDIAFCNGNADGRIGGTGGANDYAEQLLAWWHLQMNGNVDGNFTHLGSTNRFDPGINIPASAYEGTGYDLATVTAYGQTRLALRLGKPVGGATGTLQGGAVSPSEALSLDKKMDDGIAQTGEVVGLNHSTSPKDCTVTTSGEERYKLSEEIIAHTCNLVFFFEPQ